MKRVQPSFSGCLAALLVALGAPPLFAQDPPEEPPPSADEESRELMLLFEKDEVVVTATKSRGTVQKAPSIITAITGNQMRRAGMRTLLDALRLVPGVETSRNTLGQARLAVRGKRSAPQVLVLVDGVRLNDVYSGSALLELPVGMIERVEVIRGPGSALYGTNAFAGIVNVITRVDRWQGSGESSPGGARTRGPTVSVFGGSYESAGVEARVGLDQGDTSGHAYVEIDQTDGPAFRIAADGLSSSGQGLAGSPRGVTNAWRQDANAGISLTRKDALRPADRVTASVRYFRRRAGPYLGPFDTLAPDGTVARDRLLASVGWEATWSKRMESVIRIYGHQSATDQDLQLYPDDYTTGDKDGDGQPEVFPEGQRKRERYTGRTAGAEAQVRWRSSPSESVTAGVQVERSALPSYSLATNEENGAYRGPGLANYGGVPTSQRGRERMVAGVYVQDERELTDRLGLTLGIRHDQYSDFGGSTNPRAGLVWFPNDVWTFKLLYGTAFRAPTFEELYDRTEENLRGAFVGNPALRPETIRTTEAGVEGRFKAFGRPLNLRGNAYYDEIRGRIDELQATGTINRLTNFGDVNMVGGEIEGRYLMRRRTHVFANASWFRAVDLRSKTFLTDVPQWRSNVGIYLSPIDPLTLFAVWQMGAERRNNARTTLERLHDYRIESYGVLNVSVSTEPLWGHWLASASVYNALDQRRVDDVPRPDRVSGNLPVDERTFWVRLSYAR